MTYYLNLANNRKNTVMRERVNLRKEHKCKICGWDVDIVVEDYYYQAGHTSVAYYDNEQFKHMCCSEAETMTYELCPPNAHGIHPYPGVSSWATTLRICSKCGWALHLNEEWFLLKRHTHSTGNRVYHQCCISGKK